MQELNFDAVIFDLDGVITQTALVHSSAWKKMFDDYLKERELKFGEPFIEFSHESDYRLYVDGKPRYAGVESFLQSRGINLPQGSPEDPPGSQTICALGNRKNDAFFEVMDQQGIKVYESTISLIHELLARGVGIAVASSSRNCKIVLEKAEISNLFQTRVDGITTEEMGLKGKPEPDIFQKAADNLGVSYDRAVIVEDAVSGVQAARKGNFGLVLGIARENNKQELISNGADIAVTDLDELSINDIEDWFTNGLEEDMWSLSYDDYAPEKEMSRESLLTLGNGYFGNRGAMDESTANEFNYPGTYIAGIYNELESDVAGKTVANEDFVNCPDWVYTNFKIADDDWTDINKLEILQLRRSLNLRTGKLSRKMVVRDKIGRETMVCSERIVSMDNPHLAALSYQLTPLNYAEKVSIKSGLNGNIKNEGVERYKSLNQHHLVIIDTSSFNDHIYLEAKTRQSNISICEAAGFRIREKQLSQKTQQTIVEQGADILYAEFKTQLRQNETITLEKTVAVYTSKDSNVVSPYKEALNTVRSNADFDTIAEKSASAWQNIWNKADIRLEGDRLSQKLLRLHIYHTMVTASPHNRHIDAGIPARGLHGEAYRGHIFWDELFILPFYTIHYSEVSKAALLYRYRRLDKARENAANHGYKGAMFPWQSGSDGSEATQVLHLNPRSGKWGEDYSSLQRHISIAVAYNVWQYYQTTLDTDFLVNYGAELFLEIGRFWASKAEKDGNRYSIAGVMGPDEFHEKYSNSKQGGLKNNAYTNLMVSWLFEKASCITDIIGKDSMQEIFEKINMSVEEIHEWNKIGSKLKLSLSDDGIIAQFEGYFNLKELDWNAYKEKYRNISRLDRILKAEGKSPDDYKLAKQADTLMTFYTLTSSEVCEILSGLGYKVPDGFIGNNLKYYIERTSHGSTLSKVVHAKLALMAGDRDLSWDLYKDSLGSDYRDIQGGTTAEGIHAGVMAATVLSAISDFGGVNIRHEILQINPNLPNNWRRIEFGLSHRRVSYKFDISKSSIKILADSNEESEISICIKGEKYILKNKDWLTVSYS